MRQAWITKDPESGLVHDEFGGTYIYEDCGKTLAEQFPKLYFQAPIWAVWLLDLTAWLHNLAAQLCARWDTSE
jgi:hypothetical protein